MCQNGDSDPKKWGSWYLPFKHTQPQKVGSLKNSHTDTRAHTHTDEDTIMFETNPGANRKAPVNRSIPKLQPCFSRPFSSQNGPDDAEAVSEENEGKARGDHWNCCEAPKRLPGPTLTNGILLEFEDVTFMNTEFWG